MKRITIILVAVFAIVYANAQKITENDVPTSVKQAFIQKFPNANAKEVKWEKEDDTGIEANFKIDKEEYSVTFDQTGKWLETELEIKKAKLPEAVRVAIAKEFTRYKIEEAEKIETPDQELLYEVELEKKEISYAVQFTTAGKIVKKEEVKESEEKEEEEED